MKQNQYFNKKISKEAKGLYGEWSVDSGISAAQEKGFAGQILHNAYVPKENGEYTEIDVLYITKKGIFVFESKNIQGWIFGDGETPYWTHITPTGYNHKLYNPILQNRGHIQHLSKFVAHDIPFYSVIAYSKHCQIKKMSKIPANTYLVHYSDIPFVIEQVWSLQPDIMNDNQIKELFDVLVKLRTSDLNLINMHVQSVRNYKDKTNIEIEKTCPLCGSSLVIRTVKNGKNAGLKFLGCNNYPNCQYTKKYNVNLY